MICCNCWSCCLDLRAKVRLDDESIYSILFVVNKDANRRKEELSTQIEELKGLLQRPVTSQPSIVNNDNRQILNSVSISRSKQMITNVAASHQVEKLVKDSDRSSSMTPFAERFRRSQPNTPNESKTPSFSHDMHLTSTKKKQFAMSQSFSEKTPSKVQTQDSSLLINADAREFLIIRFLEEQKYEDALEKSVQLVDMRKLIVQDARNKSSAEDIDAAEIQLNRALVLLARCWRMLRRSEYSLKLLDDVLLRQREATVVNYEIMIEVLKIMLGVCDDMKQTEQAVNIMKSTIAAIRVKHGVDVQDFSKGSEPPIGLAQVIHVLAEYLADIPELIDEAIETYLQEIGIYERLRLPIDWRTLYRLGQLLARRAQYTRAIHYFDMAIELVLKLHGNNFNPLGDIYHSKALSLWQLEELPAAINLLRKAAPIKLFYLENEQENTSNPESEVALSDNAVTLAMINHALGEITEEMGHLYDAIPYFEKAMEYYTLGYGTREHMSVAQTLHGLGDLLLQLEVKKEALACFEQAYQLYSLFRGKYHIQNMDVLSGKAAVLRLMGRYQEALYVLQWIYEVYSYEFGEQDARVTEVQTAIDMVRADIECPPSPQAASMSLASSSLDETFTFSSSVAAAIISGTAMHSSGASSAGGGGHKEYSRSLASSLEDMHAASSVGATATSQPRSPGLVVTSPLFASPIQSHHLQQSSATNRMPSPRRALQLQQQHSSKQRTNSASSTYSQEMAVITSQPSASLSTNTVSTPLLQQPHTQSTDTNKDIFD